jgi:hypothetical protein
MGGTINMAQPCWDNSTQRGNNNVGPGSVGRPTRAENAYELLDMPGDWYLDVTSSNFYYIPLAGQTLANLDMEAPVLEAPVTGGGTPSCRAHRHVCRLSQTRDSQGIAGPASVIVGWDYGRQFTRFVSRTISS